MPRRMWIILAIAAIALLLGAFFLYNGMLDLSDTTLKEVERAERQQTVEFIARVEAVRTDELIVSLGEATGWDEVRIFTKQTAIIEDYRQAKIVMGSSQDVKIGAILQIRAVKTLPHRFTADRLIVLTRYVKVGS